MFSRLSGSRFFAVLLAVVFIAGGVGRAQAASLPVPLTAVLNPNPPTHTVKLIFIHHSTGENWLRDDYGLLGKTLGQNHYFVSDTNYGWGPNSIGDRTDIPNWPEWFRSSRAPTYMKALFAESGQHSTYTRTLANPGGQNTIVMFKSCFPNSNLEGNPTDPPNPNGWMTVGHAKWVYNQLQKYFRTRPDKLFIVITAPPVTDSTYAANARAFNNWLFNNWLAENSYPFSNVAVFDFYNVLTAPGAHHKYNPATGLIEHTVVAGRNTSAYPSGDDHPNSAGSKKATNEFVPLLNIFYNRWKADDIPQTSRFYSDATQDGWIRESSEASNAGGTLNVGDTTFSIGDDVANKQYRAILSFSTGASLPDTAVITSAQLRLRYSSVAPASTNPILLLQGIMLDIRKGFFGTASGLELADFQAPGAVSAGPSSPARSGGFYTINLSSTTFAAINKLATNGGLTQIRLRFKLDDNNNHLANILRLASGDSIIGSYRPSLAITYYVP